MAEKPIYLDYNATTPLLKEVKSAIVDALEWFGNASSSHVYGREAKAAIDTARKNVADLLNCTPDEIIFTSGGSESNNMAIKGAVTLNKGRGTHIVTTSIEHPAVKEVCEYLHETRGTKTSYVPVDSFGCVDAGEIEKAITEETVLISVMHSNNEVGTLQPISDIARIARTRGILFHTDASQSIGKVEVDVQKLGVDLLTVAGHKLYAPKGVGVLYVRQGVSLPKFIHGAGHEGNKRAGTENILGIVGLGEASRLARLELLDRIAKASHQTERLYTSLQAALGPGNVRLNGHPTLKLPNTANISFRNVTSQKLFEKLEGKIAASAGAACHSKGSAPSSVLVQLGVPEDFIRGTIRFSTGRDTTDEDITQAAAILSEAFKSIHQNQ